MREESILERLEELEDVLNTARAVPFTNKIGVDKDEMYEIIKEIKDLIPNEIKQSRFIVQERNKILADAQKEAEEVIAKAKEQAEALVEEHEITKKAYQKSNDILREGENQSKEMYLGSMNYAERVFSETEEKIMSMLDNVKKENIEFENFLNHNLDVLYTYRQQLKNMNDEM